MKRARTIVAIYSCTCAVPVSAVCANAHLLSFGGDLVLEFTVFILNLVLGKSTFLVVRYTYRTTGTAFTSNDKAGRLDCDSRRALGPVRTIRGLF
jgi:hypothetical protein